MDLTAAYQDTPCSKRADPTLALFLLWLKVWVGARLWTGAGIRRAGRCWLLWGRVDRIQMKYWVYHNF